MRILVKRQVSALPALMHGALMPVGVIYGLVRISAMSYSPLGRDIWKSLSFPTSLGETSQFDR